VAVITISREYGAGGNPIAGLLCDRLGYRYFDKNLMAQIGAPETLSMVLAEAETAGNVHDEHSAIWRFFRNLQADSPLGKREGLLREGEMPFETIEELIRQAYDADNVVVVGRGGQMVLRGRPGVLNVRVIAPLEKRIPTVAQFDGLPLDAARDRVHGRDRSSAGYVRQYYNVDVADPCLYDVVINTAQLSWDAAADMIVAALKHLSPRPK
jgi:CMP/dCMP kinase